MTFLHIRYFCMVAECQSISRAAKALIVSQPALSKMIRSLEDELGVSLFLREGRKMMLTADGRFFYESAVNSLAILDNVVNALTNRSQVKEIRVCINSGDLFMEEMIAEYHLQHEDIFFQIFAEAQATEPHRGGAYDLAVYTRAENQPLPGNVHPLLTESFGLAIPIRDPLSQCQSIALEQVKDRAFLATDLRPQLPALPGARLYAPAGHRRPEPARLHENAGIRDRYQHRACPDLWQIPAEELPLCAHREFYQDPHLGD